MVYKLMSFIFLLKKPINSGANKHYCHPVQKYILAFHYTESKILKI